MNDPEKAKLYRMRAVISNQRESEATGPQLKRNWEELAMEWHHLASEEERMTGDDDDIEVA
jgi:hypothetical protein